MLDRNANVSQYATQQSSCKALALRGLLCASTPRRSSEFQLGQLLHSSRRFGYVPTIRNSWDSGGRDSLIFWQIIKKIFFLHSLESFGWNHNPNSSNGSRWSRLFLFLNLRALRCPSLIAQPISWLTRRYEMLHTEAGANKRFVTGALIRRMRMTVMCE